MRSSKKLFVARFYLPAREIGHAEEVSLLRPSAARRHRHAVLRSCPMPFAAHFTAKARTVQIFTGFCMLLWCTEQG